MEKPGRVRCDAVSLEEWFPTFRSIVLPSHSRPTDPLMWAIRPSKRLVSEYSIAFPFTTKRSANVGNTISKRLVSEYSITFPFTTERSGNVGNTRFRNVLFRSIVLPSHSRPRDPVMWAIRAFETSCFGVWYCLPIHDQEIR